MAVGKTLVIKCFSRHFAADPFKLLWCKQSFVISQASYVSCRQLQEKYLCNGNLVKHKHAVRLSKDQYNSLTPPASMSTNAFLTSCNKKIWPSSVCHQTRNNYSSGQEAHLPVFLNAERHLDNVAVVDTHGNFTYADILHHSMNLAVDILQLHDAVSEMKLNGERIALLAEHDGSYVIGLYATWICNGISVPLCESHPATEWEYFLKDAKCSLLLVTDTMLERIRPVIQNVGIQYKVISRQSFGTYERNRWFQPDHASNPRKVRRVFEQRKQRWFDRTEEQVMKKPALIIYTSGTTGRPKGVVLSHGNLSSMVSGMIKNWEWTSRDAILHVLPLHHLHGIVNVLLTPLTCGATCVMEPKFDARRVWHLLTSPIIPHLDRSINVFMAVPTIYAKLIQHFDEYVTKSSIAAEMIHYTASTKIRLMVSGSAALPRPIRERWTELTGHHLLERYGMTETGMILSNSLNGLRVPETVGTPMPNVEVRISKSNVYSSYGYDIIAEGNSRHTVVTDGAHDEQGDLLVRGPSVFEKYWNKPEATSEAFTKDGWFKTGDTVKYSNGVYSIVGRTSVDVIKSGGYKISALHIEHQLLSHPDILDCAVVGVADITWGQKVAAVITLKQGKTLELKELKEWAVAFLPPYQIPTVVTFVDTIPRNVMGKVNKKEIVNQFFPESAKK